MKKTGICIFFVTAVSIAALGQQGKPLKFGVELDGRLTKAESQTIYDSPTGAAYVGMFGELNPAITSFRRGSRERQTSMPHCR
jgi:hypothetical protein